MCTGHRAPLPCSSTSNVNFMPCIREILAHISQPSSNWYIPPPMRLFRHVAIPQTLSTQITKIKFTIFPPLSASPPVLPISGEREITPFPKPETQRSFLTLLFPSPSTFSHQPLNEYFSTPSPCLQSCLTNLGSNFSFCIIATAAGLMIHLLILPNPFTTLHPESSF